MNDVLSLYTNNVLPLFTNNVLPFVTLPIGLLTVGGVVLITTLVLWPRGQGFAVWARRVGVVVFTVIGIGSAVTTYHASVLRQEAESTKSADAAKEMATIRQELSNALASNRIQEAKLSALERTATDQKQRDAERAADLEADLQKAMQDIGAMFNERNGVIELVLKDAVVNFDTDASTLQCGSKEKLSRVVGAISRVLDGVDSITIVGHTDMRGTAEHNKTLSKQRAAAVMAYLAQGGIPRKIMSSVGKSYLQPAGFNEEQSMVVIKKSNSDEKEMAENRRVQMLIRRKGSAATQAAEKQPEKPSEKRVEKH
jgi:outer membrane protein OmpA-like peptidoglycan-associated protein